MENSLSIKSLLFNGDEKQQVPSKPSCTIAVEGNIGCGKSTLLNYFADSEGGLIETLCEPIENWTNIRGHNALGLLYESPQRWTFSFNMYAMLTRVNMHTKDHIKPVKMMERSLHSTRHCFVENSFRNDDITPCEYSIINQWYDHLVSDEKGNLDLIIYLRADSSTCYDRMKKRSMQEEAGVPKDLLESLHNLYDDWLINRKVWVPAPVLVLDANPDVAIMKEKYDRIRDEISELFCKID